MNPEVRFEAGGGFLIADRQEAQVRSYDSDGGLNWHVGRRGGGPAEFGTLAVALRMPNDEVLAIDQAGKVARFASAGDSLLWTANIPFTRVEDAEVVDDSRIVFTGWSETGFDGPRIHVMDIGDFEVEASFFNPLRSTANIEAAGVVNWTRFDLRGDTIAATNATIDSVFFFTLDGSRLGSLPIPSANFRVAEAVENSQASRVDPHERARWLASYDMVGDLYWLPDGRLIVTYLYVEPSEALQQVWNFVVLDRSGRLLAEVRSAPRILAVDRDSGAVLSQTPEALVPNRWSIGRLVGS